MNVLAIGPDASISPYRDGKILVVPAGSKLPPSCVKCGAPAAEKWLTKTFRWHASWIYALAIFGLLIYAIVALIVQKQVKISVPFCELHRSWRTRMNILGAALLIGCVPASVVLGSLNFGPGLVVLVGLGMGLGGLVILAVVGSSFTAIFIDDSVARFKGAGEQFLSTLPSHSATEVRI